MSPVVIYMPICVVRAFVPLSSCNINHVCPLLLTAGRGGIQLARDMMGGGVETNHSLVDAITNCPEMQTVPHKAPQLRFPRKTVLACETLFEVHTLACSEGERKKKKRLVVGGQVQEVHAPFASEIQETAFLRNALQGSSLVDNPERTRLRFQDLRREEKRQRRRQPVAAAAATNLGRQWHASDDGARCAQHMWFAEHRQDIARWEREGAMTNALAQKKKKVVMFLLGIPSPQL